ncbi:MAG: SigE family RNA polymerase sigma factor [Acidimicrobiia bacterium]
MTNVESRTWAAPPPLTASVTAIGPTTGLWQLYERRHADMVRMAAFLCGDRHRAEDLVHEAFVRVMHRWDELADEAAAEAYVRTTIVNLIRGEHRHRQVVERRGSSMVDEWSGSAEDSALGRVSADRVLAAVSALPFRQRACVVMRFWMRMSESEIAEGLGISIGSVRTHARRGVSALQKVLGDER